MDVRMPARAFDAETNTLALGGEWDFASKDELRELAAQVDAKRTATIDLIDATFIDSTVLNEIVRTHNRLVTEGARLRVLVGDGRIVRLLNMCGIDRVVDVERGTHEHP